MNTKEKIIQEIDSLSEPQLQTILESIYSLKRKSETNHSKAIQAFLVSLEERQEVYRRLAES